MNDHAPSLSRFWPSTSWDSPSLETKPVSVTVWCGWAPSSQWKTSASQWTILSFCDKLSLVAGMVPTLQPFFDMVWAALASSSRLPLEIVHCRCFWAVFSEVPIPLVRVFPITGSWAPEGNYIDTDACSWCVLLENFKPVALYAIPLTKNDLRKFRASIGAFKHNATWEALAVFVAVRLWLPGMQVLARVRPDSLSALKTMVRLSSKSACPGALDAVLGLYLAGLTNHIRGVSIRLPDDLSRLWAPLPHLPTQTLG